MSVHITDEYDLVVVLARGLRHAVRTGEQEKTAILAATLAQTAHILRETTPAARATSAAVTHINGVVDQASVTELLPAGFAQEAALDPLSRILNAGVELARRDRDGLDLDAAELQALDCCDDIGGVRDIAADEGPHFGNGRS